RASRFSWSRRGGGQRGAASPPEETGIGGKAFRCRRVFPHLPARTPHRWFFCGHLRASEWMGVSKVRKAGLKLAATEGKRPRVVGSLGDLQRAKSGGLRYNLEFVGAEK